MSLNHKLQVPFGGISGVTEECFNDGHLDFYGDINWIREGAENNKLWNQTEWVPMEALRTKKGTYPKNSEWTKIVNGEKPNVKHCAHKDLVWVPENLEPGEYVLSLRWDCARTAQIWNSCANIIIV